MDTRVITDWNMGTPAAWGAIPPANPIPEPWPANWSNVVAAELADAHRAGRLSKRLRALRESLTHDPHTALAVWVPERSTGEIAAHLEVDSLAPLPGVPLTREWLRDAMAPVRHRGVEVFHHAIEDIELSAGPALVLTEVLGGRLRGPNPSRQSVQEYVTVVLFPPGATDALQLNFVAHGVSVNDDGRFEGQVHACVDTVTVTIGAEGL